MKILIMVLVGLLLLAPVGAFPLKKIMKKVALEPVKDTVSTIKDMVTCHDKMFCIAAWALVAAYVTDEVTTERAFLRCKTCVETGTFGGGSRSVLASAAPFGAVAFGNIALAHTIKNSSLGKERYVWPSGIIIEGTIHALAANHNEGIQ